MDLEPPSLCIICCPSLYVSLVLQILLQLNSYRYYINCFYRSFIVGVYSCVEVEIALALALPLILKITNYLTLLSRMIFML